MKTEYESLRIAQDGSVATVELTGPGKGNALGPASWREIPEVFDALNEESSVRVVVLAGAGEHFTYGLDLKTMPPMLGPHMTGNNLARARRELYTMIARLQQVGSAIAACRKPVIAAVHGLCIGGGLDIIAACDIRICSADARFSLRETKLAMVADIGSLQRLPAIIGEGHLRELAFTGRDIDAARAERIGLVNDVYPDAAALREAATQLALDISGNSPITVQGVKQVVERRVRREIADGLDYVALWNSAFLQSEDLERALMAAMSRKKPEYQDC